MKQFPRTSPTALVYIADGRSSLDYQGTVSAALVVDTVGKQALVRPSQFSVACRETTREDVTAPLQLLAPNRRKLEYGGKQN